MNNKIEALLILDTETGRKNKNCWFFLTCHLPVNYDGVCLIYTVPPHTPTTISHSLCLSVLTASKDREEKLKYARDRQNEERQRKIEELRAQAEAAQKYREQKEEERRRRIEEIRVRDTEKRHQVEERKKAIIEAEKERREYILKKNLVSSVIWKAFQTFPWLTLSHTLSSTVCTGTRIANRDKETR